MHNFLLTGLASSGESCDVEFLGSFAALLSDPIGRREVKTAAESWLTSV